MAIYKNVNELAYATIQENLDAAQHCIYCLKKEDGGCYGMSALILLTSVIDAMGSFYEQGSFTPFPDKGSDLDNRLKDKVRQHFEDMYMKYYNKYFSSKKDFTDILYHKYRCNPVHNNLLNYDYLIATANDADKNVLGKEDSKTILYIDRLYEATKVIFSQFIEDNNIILSN